jgi:hypothetical protein
VKGKRKSGVLGVCEAGRTELRRPSSFPLSHSPPKSIEYRGKGYEGRGLVGTWTRALEMGESSSLGLVA